MARPRSFDPNDLKSKALQQFWRAGYTATSIDDLVAATGVSRYGLYSEFGGKHGLYLACFETYAESVVTPAFAQVEAQGAALPDIHRYFDHQISAAATLGLPGPGCFVGNSATETAPHDADARSRVAAHNTRLSTGFAHALTNAFPHRPPETLTAHAEALTIFATGLWALSRLANEAQPLRRAVTTHLDTLERSLA